MHGVCVAALVSVTLAVKFSPLLKSVNSVVEKRVVHLLPSRKM